MLKTAGGWYTMCGKTSRLLGIVICVGIVFVLANTVQHAPMGARAEDASVQGQVAPLRSDRAWTILDVYQIPDGASGLAYDGTNLYCGIYGSNGDRVYRIDPATGSYTLQCTGPQGDAYGLTHDGTHFWTTDHPSDPATAIQFDMNGTQTASFDLPDRYMSGIAHDDGDFWVSTYYNPDGHIYKLDDQGTILTDYPAPDDQPWDLCVHNDTLWVADYWADTLYRVNASTGSVVYSHASEYSSPAGVVWDGTYLWYCDEGQGGMDNLYKIDIYGGGTPEIQLLTPSHDYGLVTIGTQATWNAVVKNIGSAPLQLTGVSFSGAGSSYLSCGISFPITIAPNNQLSVPLNYAPADVSDLNAIATVACDDPIHPTVQISLTGHGTYDGPGIHVPESSHNYGTIRVNAYRRWTMNVKNYGDASLNITAINSSDSNFIVGDTVSFPLTLQPLESVGIPVWFQPAANETYTGTLSIDSNDPDDDPYLVSVQGAGEYKTYPIGSTIWDYDVPEGPIDLSAKAILSIPDVNGDGVADVVLCTEDNYIRCLNGNADGEPAVLWEREIVSGSIYRQEEVATTEADVDGDGYPDIVVGTPWGDKSIYTLSSRTGETIWRYDTHEYGNGGWVYDVDCTYDYNGDGVADVLAATGDDSDDTGPKRVYCLDGLNGTAIWKCPLGGPVFSVIGIQDATGDGQPDVIAGASNEAETTGYVFAIDGAIGSTYWSITVPGTSVWALAEIDDASGDGIRDVIIGDFYSYGNIYGLDATDGSQLYSTTIGSTLILRFDTLSDVNGDGHPDILPSHTGSTAMVIDGQTGSQIWTQSLYDQSHSVAAAPDVTGDGVNDVFIGTLYSNNYCYFFDGTDGTQLHTPIPYTAPVDALAAIPDVTGDGTAELVAGGRDGHITCYSGGILTVNNPPASPSLSGPASGSPGTTYSYTVSTTDPDGDDLYYYVEWGDGTDSGWVGPFASGTPYTFSHSWSSTGSYVVRARAKDNHGAESTWSAPISMTVSAAQTVDIDLVVGWNLVTVPVANDFNASSLGQAITGCEIVAYWNASAGMFQSYVVGVTPGDGFAIEDGVGYFVYVNTSGTFSVTGLPISSVSVDLYAGWNTIGWYDAAATSASSLAPAVPHCSIAAYWNASSSTFESYTVGVTPPPGFAVTRGMGVFVYVTAPGTWNGQG